MDIYLVRHGQSEYNIGLTEDLDSGLTPLGLAQAEQTALRLEEAGLTHGYVSPLRRTLETIGPICRAAHVQAEIYAELCEFFSADNHAYLSFQGLSPENIVQEYPWAFIGTTFSCDLRWWPGQPETGPMLTLRAERARDALLQIHAGTDHTLVIVSHADMVGRLMEAFLRVPVYPEEPPFFENCSVTRLHCGPVLTEPADLIYANDTSHLIGLMS